MGRPPCSNQDGNEAYLSLVNLDNGEVATPCITCLPSFVLSMAAGITSKLMPEESEAYGELFDQIAANDTRTKTTTSASKGRHRRKSPDTALGIVADVHDADGSPPPGAPIAGHVLAEPESDTRMAVALDPPCDKCGSDKATGDHIALICDGCGATIATADDPNPTIPQ